MPRGSKKTPAASAGKKDTGKEAPKTDNAAPSPAPTCSDKPDLPPGDKIKRRQRLLPRSHPLKVQSIYQQHLFYSFTSNI